MLSKATLQEIASDENSTPQGDPVPVQFNPASLRLQFSNTIEGGESRGRQARQYLGSSSTTLTVDLSFDTADEGTTARARDVRERTAMVEKYVVPAGTASNEEKQAVPRVRFHWGNLIFDGIIDGITIDFDHFAEDGTPLRAKMSVSIKEQNSKYQFLKAGPGANRAGNAPVPGSPGLGAVGSLGLNAGLSVGLSAGVSLGLSADLSLGLGAGISANLSGGLTAGFSANASLALGGESAAEFSARAGLDPAAWRGLEGVSNPLALSAGAEVGFSSNLTTAAGLGATAGAGAGANAAPEKALGLEPAPGATGARSSGFALSAAGGPQAAIEQSKIARTSDAATKAVQAFSPPAARPTPPPVRQGLPAQSRAPLAQSGFPSLSRQLGAAAAPPRPLADQRATAFGFGVPLRPTIAVESGLDGPTASASVQTIPAKAARHKGGCGCGCQGSRSKR